MQERTFRFFWERANPANGLIPDRWPTPSFSSVAAVGLRPRRVSGRRRARLDHARAGRRSASLTTLRFFGRRRRGRQRAGVTGHKGFFYHFLDMDTGHRFETVELSTIDTALLIAGVLFCQRVLRRRRRARDGDPRARRLALPPRRLAVAGERSRLVIMGWQPESGYHRVRLARLQRGDDPATCSRSARRRIPIDPAVVDDVHQHVQVGHVPRPGAPRLRAAVRPSVLAHLDRLPRHPGRLHARRAASTTSRTRGARRSSQRAYAIANPDELGGLRRRRLGPDRVATDRSTPTIDDQRHERAVLHVLRRAARRSPRSATTARSRRPRPAASIAVRARDRRCRRCARCANATATASVRPVRLPRLVQSDASTFTDVAAAARHASSRRRLVRHRLPRHRPGPDPADDRELPQRAGVADHAAATRTSSRPAARRLHRRLARRARRRTR